LLVLFLDGALTTKDILRTHVRKSNPNKHNYYIILYYNSLNAQLWSPTNAFLSVR